MTAPLDCPHGSQCKEECGIYDKEAQCCGYLSGPAKVVAALDRLTAATAGNGKGGKKKE